MVLRLFYTSVTSTTGLQKKQEHIKQVLSSQKFEYDMIDICDPENEEEKKFMRANAKISKPGSVPLPPQIFNDDTYCGDYEDFYNAVEDNTLKVMLKLEDHVSQATITLSEKAVEETDKTDADSEEKTDEKVDDKETKDETVKENDNAEEESDKSTEQVSEPVTEQVSEQDIDKGDDDKSEDKSDDKVNVETSDETDKKEEDVVNDKKEEGDDSTSKSDEEPEEKVKPDEEQQQVQE